MSQATRNGGDAEFRNAETTSRGKGKAKEPLTAKEKLPTEDGGSSLTSVSPSKGKGKGKETEKDSVSSKKSTAKPRPKPRMRKASKCTGDEDNAEETVMTEGSAGGDKSPGKRQRRQLQAEEEEEYVSPTVFATKKRQRQPKDMPEPLREEGADDPSPKRPRRAASGRLLARSDTAALAETDEEDDEVSSPRKRRRRRLPKAKTATDQVTEVAYTVDPSTIIEEIGTIPGEQGSASVDATARITAGELAASDSVESVIPRAVPLKRGRPPKAQSNTTADVPSAPGRIVDPVADPDTSGDGSKLVEGAPLAAQQTLSTTSWGDAVLDAETNTSSVGPRRQSARVAGRKRPD